MRRPKQEGTAHRDAPPLDPKTSPAVTGRGAAGRLAEIGSRVRIVDCARNGCYLVVSFTDPKTKRTKTNTFVHEAACNLSISALTLYTERVGGSNPSPPTSKIKYLDQNSHVIFYKTRRAHLSWQQSTNFVNRCVVSKVALPQFGYGCLGRLKDYRSEAQILIALLHHQRIEAQPPKILRTDHRPLTRDRTASEKCCAPCGASRRRCRSDRPTKGNRPRIIGSGAFGVRRPGYYGCSDCQNVDARSVYHASTTAA